MTTQRRQHTKRDVNAAARLELALALRRQRVSYEVIADKCGYGDRAAAFNAIQRALARNEAEDIESYRQEEINILDELHSTLWACTFSPDASIDLDIIDRLLDISAARRKLLGLDTQVDSTPLGATLVREIGAPLGEV